MVDGLGGVFDYVGAPPTFNIRIADHDVFLRAMLGVIYRPAPRRGLQHPSTLVRAPPELSPPGHAAVTWSTEELVPACRSLGASVELREGYLPGEFTLYLRREPG